MKQRTVNADMESFFDFVSHKNHGQNALAELSDFREWMDEVEAGNTGPVLCVDCGWQGKGYQLKAQACPVCDGRCADC